MENSFDSDMASKRYGLNLAEGAEFYRSIALIVDQDPNAIYDYINNPWIENNLNDRDSNCIDRIKSVEAFAYGDANTLLATPGSSLCGIMIREIGNREQQEEFFSFVKQKKARTFLAITEPSKGSDAGKLSTSLKQSDRDQNEYILEGEKCLVGNAASGEIGIVIARTNSGPFGTSALLLTPEILLFHSKQNESKLLRIPMPMAGLTGCQLGYLKFDKIPVPKKNILGINMHIATRGMMAVIKTFNRMRPSVSALAIGTAQAIVDYLILNRRAFTSNEKHLIELMSTKIEFSRKLLQHAALNIENNPMDGTIVSIAKVKAISTIEFVAQQAPNLLGKGAFFEHPLIAKWYRDSFAFEFMEGTSLIQKKNIFLGYFNNARKTSDRNNSTIISKEKII